MAAYYNDAQDGFTISKQGVSISGTQFYNRLNTSKPLSIPYFALTQDSGYQRVFVVCHAGLDDFDNIARLKNSGTHLFTFLKDAFGDKCVPAERVEIIEPHIFRNEPGHNAGVVTVVVRNATIEQVADALAGAGPHYEKAVPAEKRRAGGMFQDPKDAEDFRVAAQKRQELYSRKIEALARDGTIPPHTYKNLKDHETKNSGSSTWVSLSRADLGRTR